MKNVLIVGIGGQGNVLASRILAQVSSEKGWHVRTAETIGMAQRGGSVASHVRMGDEGEYVYAPLISRGMADVIIALEPGEGFRALPYLSQNGLMVCAQTAIPSVETTLSNKIYDGHPYLDALRWQSPHFLAINDAKLCAQIGSRKVLNVCMLASAVAASCASVSVSGQSVSKQPFGLGDSITKDDLVHAMHARVKPQYQDLNEKAINAAFAAVRSGDTLCK